MGIARKLLAGTRWYQALSFAYNEFQARQSMCPGASKLAHCGTGTIVQPRVRITHPSRVYLGDGTTIQNDTMLASMGGVHVGDYVGIGYSVTILTFNHSYRNSTSLPYDQKVFLQPVIIRDLAWLGWHTRVMPGVEIGEGAIVAMGSVVTKNVAPLAIVMGNPAEVIGRRSEEHFQRCREAGAVNPHRVREVFGEFEEIIPVMTKRRYRQELIDLGLLEDKE